jgi:hypothetical protein
MKTTVTQEDVDAAIVETHFWKAGRKTTVGFARLSNGFEIVATSACVDPEKYDEKIGEEYALKRIKDKAWELLGFQLQCELAGTKLLGGKDEQKPI